jgi:hypothetical protein
MSAPAVTVLDFATEAAAIDDAREAAHAGLRAANVRGVTGDDLDAFSGAMESVQQRCEILRRAFYPRRAQLWIGNGTAMTLSATGRSRRIVWQRPR